MERRVRAWGLVLLILPVLSACAPAPPAERSERPMGPPLCASMDEVGTTRLLDPRPFTMIGATATGDGDWPYPVEFTWEYEGDCWPNGGFGFLVEPESEVYGWVPVAGPDLVIRVPLEPGELYHWMAWPIQDGVNARQVPPGEGPRPGFAPRSVSFYTGPLCDVDAYLAPSLVSPADGTGVDTLTPTLRWEYEGSGTCLPPSFTVDLSRESDLTPPDLVLDLGVPALAVSPADPLLNCTRYYWRVAASGGGATGPLSDTWSFWTDSSTNATACLGFDPGPIITIPPAIRFGRPLLPRSCRLGPAEAYDLVRYLLPDVDVQILARDFDGSWLQVEGDDVPRCWVPGDELEFDIPGFDPMTLPLGSWPLLPTKTPGGEGGTPGCMRPVPPPNGPKTCTPGACGPNEPQDPCTL